MIKTSATITEKDMGMEALKRRLRSDASHVDIGIHADEDQKLIVIAAANEFGATINHPGGTSYGYATADDQRRRRMRFLKSGTGFKVIGITKPHIITIPARPYIRSTVDENQDRYQAISKKLFGKIIDGDMDKAEALEIMGQLIEGDIKRKIITLRSPANKPATIRRKGSSNPLVDTGLLGGSIRYIVKSEGDE
jgi:phage gpG-like protein